MKRLNIEDLKFVEPSTPNKQMMINHNYYDGINIQDKYFENVKLYSYYLEIYLSNKLKLEELEKVIEESPLNFITIKEGKDIYQEESIFKYFYLRNYPHIERLDKEEQEILSKKLTIDEIIFFIESSYKKVISIDCEGDYINYGPENINFFARKTDLVLGFRYDEYTQNGNTDEEKLANYFSQLEFLNKISDKIEELARENNIELKLIKYDYNSVYTKDSEEKNNTY